MCQKFSGGPFGAFITYPTDGVIYKEGLEFKKTIQSSDWAQRSFCSECGTSLEYIFKKKPEDTSLAAGILDSDPKIKPDKHIFTKDKCSWFEITDGLEEIERY
jgi:hypothetical protein